MVEYDFNKKLTGGIILDEHLQNIVIVRGRVSGKWGLPKGHKELGETHLQGAIREIKEETGLNLVLLVEVLPCILTRRAKLFLISLEKEKCNFYINDQNEILEVKWYPIDQLDKLDNKTQMLRSLIPRIDHIKRKIKANQANYKIREDFSDEEINSLNLVVENSNNTREKPEGPISMDMDSEYPDQLVLNKFLLNSFIQSINKPVNQIVCQIKRSFPQLFYEPELRSGILKVKENYRISPLFVDKKCSISASKTSKKSKKWLSKYSNQALVA